jgi:hypothetical protein
VPAGKLDTLITPDAGIVVAERNEMMQALLAMPLRWTLPRGDCVHVELRELLINQDCRTASGLVANRMSR